MFGTIALTRVCDPAARYCAKNPCVEAFQGITLVYAAPLCLLLAVLVLRRSRWRHVVQAPVCTGQMYGTLIYFLSAGVKGFVDIAPAADHFWLRFVALNSLWVVIPGMLLIQSLRKFKALLDQDAARAVHEHAE